MNELTSALATALSRDTLNAAEVLEIIAADHARQAARIAELEAEREVMLRKLYEADAAMRQAQTPQREDAPAWAAGAVVERTVYRTDYDPTVFSASIILLATRHASGPSGQ